MRLCMTVIIILAALGPLAVDAYTPSLRDCIRVDPPCINFGLAPVSEVSDASWLTRASAVIRNNSAESIRIRSIRIEGDGGNCFKVCSDELIGSAIPAGGEKVIVLEFSSVRDGPKTALLAIKLQNGESLKIPLSADGFMASSADGLDNLPRWAKKLAQEGDTIQVLGDIPFDIGFRPRCIALAKKEIERLYLDESRKIAIGGRGGEREKILIYRARPRVSGAVDLSFIRSIPLGSRGEFDPIRGLCALRVKSRRGNAAFLTAQTEKITLLNERGQILARKRNGYENLGILRPSKIEPHKAFCVQRDAATGTRYLTRILAKKWEEAPPFLQNNTYSLVMEPREISSILGLNYPQERILDMKIAPVTFSESGDLRAYEHAMFLVKSEEPMGPGASNDTVTYKLARLGRFGAALERPRPPVVLEARRNISILGRKPKGLAYAERKEKNSNGLPARVGVRYDGGRIGSYSVNRVGDSWTIEPRQSTSVSSMPKDMDIVSMGRMWHLVLHGRERSSLELLMSREDGFAEVASGVVAIERPQRFGVDARRKRCYVAAHDSVLSTGRLVACETAIPADTNRAPFAFAGWDTIVYAIGSEGAIVTLHGQAYDPEGQPLLYSWSAPYVNFDDPTSLTPTGYFPMGVNVVYFVAKEEEDYGGRESVPSVMSVIVETPTGVEEGEKGNAPKGKSVFAPGCFFPNPATGYSTLNLDIGFEARVEVAIYDVAGRRVRNLDSKKVSIGRHEITWDTKDDSGRNLPSGLYFGLIRAGKHCAVRRVVILR